MFQVHYDDSSQDQLIIQLYLLPAICQLNGYSTLRNTLECSLEQNVNFEDGKKNRSILVTGAIHCKQASIALIHSEAVMAHLASMSDCKAFNCTQG